MTALRLSLCCLLAACTAHRTPATTAEPNPVQPPAEPQTCAAVFAATSVCAPTEGCVMDDADSCREARTACERVVPAMKRYPGHDPYPFPGGLVDGLRATWLEGDPCALTDPSCAYDLTLGSCRAFAPVDQCPQTADEALALTVSCTHPDQSPLSCPYEDVVVSCIRPWTPTIGMPPAPGAHDRPALVWQPAWDHDDAGCPTSERGIAMPCTPDAPQGCTSFDTRWTCVDGTWSGEPLPPPP